MVVHTFNMYATVVKAPPESDYGPPVEAPDRKMVKCRANGVRLEEIATAQGLRTVVRRRFYFAPNVPIQVTDRIEADGVTYRVEAVSPERDIIGNIVFFQVDTVGVAV